MRTHKITTRISFYSSLAALSLLLIFHNNDICLSVFTGFFASSLLSLFISISNYLVLRKNIVESIVVSVYKMNTESFSALYSTDKNLTLEEIQKVLGILTDRLYNIYVENHELLIGLFEYDKRKKNILELETLVEKRIKKINEIEYYIEFFEKDALTQTKQIYQDLDKIIDDSTIYLKALHNNKLYKGEFFSKEPYDKDDTWKKSLGAKYQATLER